MSVSRSILLLASATVSFWSGVATVPLIVPDRPLVHDIVGLAPKIEKALSSVASVDSKSSDRSAQTLFGDHGVWTDDDTQAFRASLGERSFEENLFLLSELAKEDPNLAADLAGSMFNGRPAEALTNAILAEVGVLHGMSAIEWYLLDRQGKRGKGLFSIYDGWCQSDPAGVVQFLQNNEAESFSGREAYHALVREYGFRGGNQEVLKLVNDFKGPISQSMAAFESVAYVYKSDPNLAKAWVAKRIDEAYIAEAALGLSRQMAKESAGNAVSWIEQNASEDLRAKMSAEVAKVWSWGDPAGAVDWMRSLEPGVVYDAVVESTLGRLKRFDEDSAIVLVKAISNRAVRERLERQYFNL